MKDRLLKIHIQVKMNTDGGLMETNKSHLNDESI